MESGEMQNLAAVQVARQWSEYEPSFAIEWASGFNDADSRQQAYQGILQRWAGEDLESAGAWLLKQPVSENRDQLVETLVGSIGHQDPEMGVIWASGISGQQRREQMVEQYARVWLDQDREQALTWLEKNPLSPEALHRLINPGQPFPYEAASPGLETTPAESIAPAIPVMDLEMMRRYGLIPE